MGQAADRKKATGSGSALSPFHICPAEQYWLMVFFNQVQSPDHDDRRAREAVFAELGMIDLAESIAFGEKVIFEGEWTSRAPIDHPVSRRVVDYLIKLLEQPAPGHISLVLGRLRDRLVSVREGKYTPPEPPEAAPAEAADR